MRRIAIDVRMVRISGVGRYIREVVPRVLNRSPSMRASFLGGGADGEALARRSGGGAEHHRFDAPIYTLREQARFPAIIPPETDLLWCPHYNVPLLYPGRMLVTVHDVLYLARPEFIKGAHRRYAGQLLFRAVRARASTVICGSEFSAGELQDHTGIPWERIRVIPYGVGEEWFDPPPPRAHQRPYFVFVGNVKPHKNLRGLIEAFESLLDRLPHDLIVVGRKDGFASGDSAVIRRAARLGDRCRFTGELSDEQVRSYIANAEALVLPSFYEGFGLPALEAMASGCPAIVSRAASLPEVCGAAALYFDPADPVAIAGEMRRVAEDRGLRAELIDAGREHARRFSWEDTASETSRVISEELEAL